MVPVVEEALVASTGIESVIVIRAADTQIDRFTKLDEAKNHEEHEVSVSEATFLVHPHIDPEAVQGLNN